MKIAVALLCCLPLLLKAQNKYERCPMECAFAPYYRYDTLQVVDQPERVKVLVMPPLYIYSSDSVFDVEASGKKLYPTLYTLTFDRHGNEHIKRLSAKPRLFYASPTQRLKEQVLPVNRTLKQTVVLPATYTLVVEKRLIEKQDNKIVEVICDDAVDTALIEEVSRELFIRGYTKSVSTQRDSAFKAALDHFQRENGLPLCEFNIITLSMLGVQL